MGAFLLPLVFVLFSHTAGLNTDEAAPIKLHAKSISKCACDGPCILDLVDMEMMMKEHSQLSFKSKMVIKENTCKELNGEITLTFCDKDGSNCFDQEPFPVNKLCQHLGDKNTMWETIIQKLKELGFVPECPVKKGKYEMKDVLVDMKPIEKYKPEPGRWTGKFVAKCQKKKVFCIVMEILVEALGLE